jgi:TolB-like protein
LAEELHQGDVFHTHSPSQGFRLTSAVEPVGPALPIQKNDTVSGEEQPAARRHNQPAIAVFPFRMFGQIETIGAIANAVKSELITSLARLRWLKVIARRSSFRFREATLESQPLQILKAACYIM